MEQNKRSLTERRYDIDWMRNMVIMLLFPFHAARVFDYWEPNYVKNADLSWPLSWLIFLIGYWFMPLLFVLAGSSSWYALEFRSGIKYIRERFSRLFIPFLFGILVIVPPQAYFAKLAQPGYSGSYLGFLKGYFVDFSDLSGYFGSFTPAHLWFILYLFVFSLAALPLFLFLKKGAIREKISLRAKLISNPFLLISLFIPLTLTEALPAPGGKNPFFYMVFFLAGYCISTTPAFQEVINRIRFRLLLFLIPYTPFWILLQQKNSGAADFSPMSIIVAFIRNLAIWLLLLVILGYGNKFLKRKSKWLPYMNEAAFPVYILHQTVMMFIAFFVVKPNMGILPKYLLIMTLTFISCLAIYEFILKHTGVTRVLFGIKYRKTGGK